MTRYHAYADAADVAIALIAEPAVAAAWREPSALEKFSVGGLAAHLARQITRVIEDLNEPAPDNPPIPVVDHYGRSAWVGADIDDESNAGIRSRGEDDAEAGAGAVLDGARAALAELRRRLPGEPADRLIAVPAGWSLTLDDFLLTRMLEIAVHCDDLAVSVHIGTPALPAEVLEPVLELLGRLAVRRHGPTAILRALSRAERAPATIAAI